MSSVMSTSQGMAQSEIARIEGEGEKLRSVLRNARRVIKGNLPTHMISPPPSSVLTWRPDTYFSWKAGPYPIPPSAMQGTTCLHIHCYYMSIFWAPLLAPTATRGDELMTRMKRVHLSHTPPYRFHTPRQQRVLLFFIDIWPEQSPSLCGCSI
jgi:hypothetical protein